MSHRDASPQRASSSNDAAHSKEAELRSQLLASRRSAGGRDEPSASLSRHRRGPDDAGAGAWGRGTPPHLSSGGGGAVPGFGGASGGYDPSRPPPGFEARVPPPPPREYGSGNYGYGAPPPSHGERGGWGNRGQQHQQHQQHGQGQRYGAGPEIYNEAPPPPGAWNRAPPREQGFTAAGGDKSFFER